MVIRIFDCKEDVVVETSEGGFALRKNELSGRIITTDKGFGIQHEGVYVGVDSREVWWAFHNHPETGQPSLVPAHEFTSGPEVRCKIEDCGFSQHEVLIRAMHEFFRSEPYSFLSYNCQHYTSKSCNGSNKSWQLENVAKGVLAATAGVAIGAFIVGVFSEA